MQYLLTEEEYKTVLAKRNFVDHHQLMFVIDIFDKINLIPDSTKKLSVLDTVSNKLNMFQQSGNKLYLTDITEMFE